MATPLELVRQACDTALTTDEGVPVPLNLDPGLSSEELEALQARLPCPLPADVRELLAHSRGFTGGATDLVDFTGEGCEFEFYAAFPHGHPIAADGYGNFWIVDLLPQSTHWGPIYFVCHDAPVILYQSPSLDHFLAELFRMSVPPYKSLVDDVHEDRLFKVWATNPGVLSYEQAASAADPEIRAFAQSLGPTFQIIDLRDAPIGFGFSWGRYGPQTVVRRHGTLRIFAYEQRKGLFGRLFGR